MLIRILASCPKFKKEEKKSKSKKWKLKHDNDDDDDDDDNDDECIPGPSRSMACTKLTSQKCCKIDDSNPPSKTHSRKRCNRSPSPVPSFNSDNNNNDIDRVSGPSHSKTHARPTSWKHSKVNHYNPPSKSHSRKHCKPSLSPSNSDNESTSSKGIQEVAKSSKKAAQRYDAYASPSNSHSHQANKQHPKRVEMHRWLK